MREIYELEKINKMIKRTVYERDRDRDTMSFHLEVDGPDPILKSSRLASYFRTNIPLKILK
jgi:hypothetical protein